MSVRLPSNLDALKCHVGTLFVFGGFDQWSFKQHLCCFSHFDPWGPRPLLLLQLVRRRVQNQCWRGAIGFLFAGLNGQRRSRSAVGGGGGGVVGTVKTG